MVRTSLLLSDDVCRRCNLACDRFFTLVVKFLQAPFWRPCTLAPGGICTPFPSLSYASVSKSKKVSICKDLQEHKESDRKYWCKVLARVLSVIKFLSLRGLAFRGSSELVGSPQNGNFLGILELLTGYDTFLAEHIQKSVNKSKAHVSYFYLTVCEEFTDVIATKELDIIISKIKQAKYYSVSVYSTSDITNVDQLAIIFQYVLSDGPV